MISLGARRLFLFWTICVFSLLSSCSSIQLGYNQIDFLLKWRIDDFIDITTDQSQFYDQAFPLVIKKHRQEELPKVLQKLRSIRSKLDQALRVEDGVTIVKEVKSLSKDSIYLLIDDASTLALMLQPKQIAYMENALNKSNKKFQADFLKGSPDERLEKRIEKVIERTESFAGDLSKSQKASIKEIAKEHLLDMENVYQTRLFKQQLIIKTLKKIVQEQPSHAQTKIMITQLFLEIEQGSTPEQKEFEKNRDVQSGTILAKITQLFDDQQRKKTQAKLRTWENDVQSLIQQKSKS
jgi:predicted RND superfamily exporter protein